MTHGYRRIRRASLVYVHDLIMTGVAFGIALYLRVGHEATFGKYHAGLVLGMTTSVLIAAIVYRQLGLYRAVWRYASLPDLLQLAKAVTITSLAFIMAMFLLNRLSLVPRSVPLIQWFVQLVLLGGSRFVYRLFKDGRLPSFDASQMDRRIPVLLLGTGAEAETFIRVQAHDRSAPYRVVGMLDTKGSRIGREIRGVRVLGQVEDLPEIVNQLGRRGLRPQRLILTRPLSGDKRAWMRTLLDQIEALGLTVSQLPNLTEFKDALLTSGRIELKPVAVEDLLGRPQTVLNRNAIQGLVKKRRVLITGAGGTIGSELTRQIAALEPAELILVESSEFNLYTIDMEIRERFPGVVYHSLLADVRDQALMLRIFMERRPELVFHAAALKHVPLVEQNLIEGVLTNVVGTRNVADAARACGTHAMVMVSTDKAVRPTSVMGATKRFAESYCQALDVHALRGTGTPTRFMTVRFGNVLGSSGSVVPLFQRQLAKGGPLTVTHPDMRRYFMTVREAVELVLQASAHGVAHPNERGKIFVLDMGEPIKIVDLARQMIRLAGFRPDIDVKIEFTGLRPGEKLFEEILYSVEEPSCTEVEGVFLAAPRVIDYALLNRALQEMETATRVGDEARVMTILGNIVSDYSAMREVATHRDAQ